MDNVRILMKILEKNEHCEKMLNGNILFRPVKYFNQIEDASVRGDKYDGQEKIYDPRTTEVVIAGMNITGISDKILYSRSSSLTNMKICSLYLLNADTELKAQYDDRLFDFGNYCVVITSPRDFITRVKNAIDSLYPSTFRSRTIDYVNMDAVNGDFGIFRKPDTYQWQNEYRLIFKSDNSEKEFINIGDIRDIAKIYKLSDFLDLFQRKS